MRRWLTVGAFLSLVGWTAAAAPAAFAAASGPGYAGSGGAPLSVPYVSQLTAVAGFGWRVADYACGPASAAMVASYWSGNTPALGRAEAIMGGTALIGVGSEPWQVAQAIRSLAPGVGADAASADGASAALGVLSGQLSQGRPVVALVHPSWFSTPINHFVVVTGYNRALGVVTFQDPLVGAQVQEPSADFLLAWAHPRHGQPYTYVWSNGGYNQPSDVPSSAAPAMAPVASSTIGASAGSSGSDVTPSATTFDIGDTVSVVSVGLRVHAGPDVSQDVVAYLAQGDLGRVVAANDGWLQLRLADGTVGWVNDAFVAAS